MSMEKGEQIVGHAPWELSINVWDAEGKQLANSLEEEGKEQIEITMYICTAS